ncbi:MAG: helix-turn-helix domain-containing protein [Candidatus Fibromonas sp.]|nr:helix-turn-helix domain-containing protein [Candidatus Fibromonas sp.]
MLAVVNRPRIEIRAKRIPVKQMNFIRLEYPNVVVKKDNEDSDEVDFTELEWFKETWASMTPGENLKLLREEQRISKKELSEKCGISLVRISDYESGRVKISQSIAKKLAKVLGTAEENLYW